MSSIPREHHYVPAVHIRKFQSESGFHLYQKKTGQFFNPTDSRQIFKKRDLNSLRYSIESQTDHISLERDLDEKFDSKFNKHYVVFIEFIQKAIENNLFNITEICDTIKYFFEYGLIGVFRRMKMNPEYHNTDFDILAEGISTFKSLSPEKYAEFEARITPHLPENANLYDFTMKALNSYKQASETLKYPITIPTDFTEFLPDKLIVEIFIARESSFILPDTTGFFIPSANKFLLRNAVETHKVKTLAFPLNPSIVIQLKDQQEFPGEEDIISIMNHNDVTKTNKLFLKYSQTAVLGLSKQVILESIS